MDPFTQAAGRFHARSAVFWKRTDTPLLRAVASGSQRGELIDAFRWEEAQPDCLRPLCTVEAPFEDARTYFAAVTERVLATYQGLRDAGRDAGIELPEVNEVASPLPVVVAVRTAQAVAASLPASLEGLTVLLAPERVQDEQGWAAQVGVLSKAVKGLSNEGSGSSGKGRLRWVVCDRRGGPLHAVLGEGVELSLDEGALFDFWKGMLTRAAPAAGSAKGTPHEGSPAGLSTEGAAAVRAHLLAATEQLRGGAPKRSAEAFRAAAAICADAALIVEEAGLRMAAAGAELAVPAPARAAAEYGRAAALAETGGATTLACQAKLGEGAAELSQKRRPEAVAAYERAAELAHEAGAALLRVEALRMAGVSHLLAGDTRETVRLWQTAVDAGLRLPSAARERTTFAQVAHDVIALLDRLGQRSEAEEVRKRIGKESGAREEESAHDEPTSSLEPAEEANATQAIPIRMPRKALPFVKGPIDPDWLDALVRAAETERLPQAEAAALEPANLTRPIVLVAPAARALPFDPGGSDPTNTTQVVLLPHREKALPFAPGAVAVASFRPPPEDTLDDTLDANETGEK